MTNTWYVYMLQLDNRSLYTGITNDVDNRMKLHNEGKGSKYVRAFLPFKLVYVEKIKGGRSEAQKREREIKKSGKMKKFLILSSPNNLVWDPKFKKWAGAATMRL